MIQWFGEVKRAAPRALIEIVGTASKKEDNS
jgi:hypothetical protein